jgi:hypothetical protein
LNLDSQINPNICLSRKDILEEDRRKSFIRVLSKNSPRDVSHILDSQLKKPKTSALPLNLLDMKKWLSEGKSRNPTSSKELESIQDWLEEMNKVHLPCLENFLSGRETPPDELVEKVETIYYVALNEVLRQVSVLCKSRAEVLKNIIQVLSSVWRKYIESLRVAAEAATEATLLDLEANELANQVKIVKFQEQVQSLNLEIQRLNQENFNITEERIELRESVQSLEKMVLEVKSNWKEPPLVRHVFIQTEQGEGLGVSRSSRSSSLTETSFMMTPLPGEDDKVNDLVLKSSKEMFKEEFISLWQGLKCDHLPAEDLAERLSLEVKDLHQWLEGFKFALQIQKNQTETLINPPSSANHFTGESPRIQLKQVTSKIK